MKTSITNLVTWGGLSPWTSHCFRLSNMNAAERGIRTAMLWYRNRWRLETKSIIDVDII